MKYTYINFFKKKFTMFPKIISLGNTIEWAWQLLCLHGCLVRCLLWRECGHQLLQIMQKHCVRKKMRKSRRTGERTVLRKHRLKKKIGKTFDPKQNMLHWEGILSPSRSRMAAPFGVLTCFCPVHSLRQLTDQSALAVCT